MEKCPKCDRVMVAKDIFKGVKKCFNSECGWIEGRQNEDTASNKLCLNFTRYEKLRQNGEKQLPVLCLK